MESCELCDIFRGECACAVLGVDLPKKSFSGIHAGCHVISCSPPTHTHTTVTILMLCILGMMNIDTSALYHIVRAQSVIKLYVIYNMLEVCWLAA